jgi:nickel-dependent lactate racemase
MTTRPWLPRFPDLRGVEDNVLFVIAPEVVERPIDVEKEIRASLQQPIASPPLAEIVSSGDCVLLLADDVTRPTPRSRLIPPVLDELNAAGVPDAQIAILIALGTHRPMTEGEIDEAFGREVIRRVPVLNHDFRDPRQLVPIGHTEQGTPIIVNRRVVEADFVLGVGSIVPHPEAGWSGGAKIFQPGVCGEETTAWTHMLAARQPDHLALAGVEENPVRREIERVAIQGGLKFIVNVVFDGAGKVVKVVTGDPVRAHRAGVAFARRIFVRAIPEQADIVVVDARPADMDYWQGIKPLAFATRAVKEGGTVILVGDFRDGISPIYDAEFRAFGNKGRDELCKAERTHELGHGVCTEALYLHAAILERNDVICVCDGISTDGRNALGFRSAGSVREALELAFEKAQAKATVGVILQGGDVLPCVDEKGEKDYR